MHNEVGEVYIRFTLSIRLSVNLSVHLSIRLSINSPGREDCVLYYWILQSPRKGQIMLRFDAFQVVNLNFWTVKSLVIWNTMTLMWLHRNAIHMTKT